jgi:beta-N-acetylhexosaminidase
MHFDKKHLLLLTAIGLLLMLYISGCASTKVSIIPENWVETTLKNMTLEEKVAQLFIVRANGYYVSDESDQYRRLVHLVKDRHVGGLVFFQGDVYSTAVIINRLQKISKTPLLIAADFEWGAAMRLRRATRFPEAMAIGATRDTALAFLMGRAIAEESKAIGIHQVYAPVADINSNPDNSVINTRSFGEQPKLVAEMSSAVARGLQSGGIIATAKHFPGHGDTQTDSHLGLPTLNASQERLDSVELVPFKRLVEDGIFSVMVAHLAVPALDANRNLPSTFSKAIVENLLQEKIGFPGLVVTDALDMGAIVNSFGSDSAAVLAIDAGVDMLMLPDDEDVAIDAVVKAVRSGRLSEDRIDRSIKKILIFKRWAGLDHQRTVNVEEISATVETPEHLQLAKAIAQASITLLKNETVIPLTQFNSKKILNVIISDAEDYRTEINRPNTSAPNERVGDYLASQLKKRIKNISTFRLDPSSNEMAIKSILKSAEASDIVLVSIFSKARSGSGKFGLSSNLVDAIDGLLALGKTTLLIAMGSPYVLQSFPNASAYLCSYSDAECTAEATVEILCGEVPARGKLPVTIPGLFGYGRGLYMQQSILRKDFPESVGFNSDTLAKLDTIIQCAIRDTAFPGAQVVVVRNDADVYNKSFGRLEYSSSSQRVTGTTMYDIASLTKVIATTAAIMRLYDEAKLSLDESVVKYLPEFGNHGKEKITIRNLLLHNSGLPAFKRFYITCRTAEEVLDSIYNSELSFPVGDSTVYSDFGFIMLGKVVEKIAGVSLDVYVDSVFYRSLGMEHTMFKPSSSLWSNIAPTEFDAAWRKQLVRGSVHDETAALLGGVAGHAGLFSTASDLAIFMQMIMDGGSYGGKQYLKPETIKLFTTRQSKNSLRALGWDTKTMNGYSSAGKLFGEKSFGHTGFTGTSIWVELEKNIFVILLTNRVHPTRNNTKIMQIRPKVHDAVMKAIHR